MLQLFLSLFSLTALVLALSQDAKHRRWAPFVGLCGQPFWLHETYAAQQWGMFLLSIAYTLVYLWAIYQLYKLRWKT